MLILTIENVMTGQVGYEKNGQQNLWQKKINVEI